MEDLCLPFELVGFLKLSKAKGTPDFDIQHYKDTVEVISRNIIFLLIFSKSLQKHAHVIYRDFFHL